MAIITTREIGATAIQTPLSNEQLDNNFINLNADIATRVPASEKGAVNGVATLDGAGKVPTAQLPSYVDDVVEYDNLAAFPAPGETSKIYVARDTNKTYRWGGSSYTAIASGSVDSVAGKTGVVALVKGDVGLANVDNTSDADKPVSTATQTALNTKQAALGYTPVNKAGDTITGDLLNSAAYSAPNNASGVGTALKIRGSTGTGAAGAAGGNGHIEILGGGAASAWESFSGNATRGGILVQSGTAQGDAGNTYVAGSALQLRAGAGTNNGAQVGFGGTVTIYAGNTARTDGNTSGGGGLTLWGGRGTQSGYFSLGGGAMGFGNDFASTQSGGISSYPGTLTEGGETNISGGGYSTGSAQSYTTNTGGYIVLKGGTATTGGDIAFYPGSVYEGIAGGVNGTVKVNNNIVLHAGNYSSYAQPLLVSGTTIKTINGTSVLGSGDIVISSGPPGSTYLPLAGGTMTGALTVAYTVESPSDSTATALSYGRLQGFGHIHINADTDQSTTEFVYITAGYATASSSSANGLAVGNSTLTWKDNAVLHAGNYNSYALPLSGGTVSGYTTFSANVNMTSTDSYLPGHFFTNTHDGTNVYFHVGGSGSTTNKILNLRVLNNSGGNSLYQFDVNRLDAPNLQINGNQVLHAGNYGGYSTFSGAVTSAGNTGFRNDVYYSSVRNPIWSFGNATSYGISYFQGTAGIGDSDVIGIHPNGTATATGASFAVGTANSYVNNNIVLHAGNYTNYAAAASHSHNYIPVNPDGDGASWTYSDENPIINGVSVGGGQRFGADGSSFEGFLQAKIVNAHNGFVNSANGYYLGNYDFGANGNTYSTNQVIDSSGNFIVGPNNASTAYGTAASGKLYFGTAAADANAHYHITTNMSDYGGNYAKLDFKWYTGQRFYAAAVYGGFRFYDIVSGSEVFSINRGDSNARVGENIVLHAGNVGSYAVTGLSDTLATVTARGNTATAGNLGLPAGEGYGFTFWGNGDNYKISMGESAGTYQYGPVTDYSIKTQMDPGSTGRGFTWGRSGVKPIAALNSTSGDMQIAGTFSAASKSFLIPHPTKPGLQLRYGSLEGPENGVYVRGKLKGSNKIELPEYWTKLVDPDSITVTLTPIGKHQKLYVEDISNNVVTVANDGLFAGEINCFFVVYGERVDIDKLVVEYE